MLQLVQERRSERREVRLGGFAGWALEWMRALGQRSGMRARSSRQMRLVETLALGGRKQLLLIACGGDRFLVGTGPDSVETIVRLQTPLEFAKRPGAREAGESL